ncbi:tyrosine-type recombinase/integrase [Streptomyces sp. WMMB 322]|uniref:tyrosine-type recombinase/integrase n=1 Tax=Streptomyces sp. WMMB 322 TaxID=1286821 RepID=UPI0034A0C840
MLRVARLQLLGPFVTLPGFNCWVSGKRRCSPRIHHLRKPVAGRVRAPPGSREDGTQPAPPLPTARLHDLRHLHATMLPLTGVPVHVVAVRLGHRDSSITSRVYAHVIKDQIADVAETFAQALTDNDESPG